MDKIKTVKIKNEDGSISEETYTISVDAKNVDMANGKELQETIGTIDVDINGNIAEQLKNLNNNVDNLNIDIEKKIYFFNTVADMKNAHFLKDGDSVQTLGYYTVNDNGAAFYKIRTVKQNETIDEMFIIKISNTIVAELIINLPLRVEQIGAKGDGITDDTIFIQKALNKVNDILMEKEYKITEIVINRSDVHLKFNIIKGTIKIDATQLIQLVDIQGDRLINVSGIGLSLVSHSGHGIQYCKFSIGLIRANVCINFDSTNNGWINNNYFYKTNVSYGTGIKSLAIPSTNSYNANYFNNFGFEDLPLWFDLNNFQDAKFTDCRMIPFESNHIIGTEIKDLGILINSSGIIFDNAQGTYFEYINTNNNTNIIIKNRLMESGGVSDGIYARISNGNIVYLIPAKNQCVLTLSELVGSTVIEPFRYDLTKPIIINADDTKYHYFNLNIIESMCYYLKTISIQIIGTCGDLQFNLRGQAFHNINNGTTDTTKTFSFINE